MGEARVIPIEGSRTHQGRSRASSDVAAGAHRAGGERARRRRRTTPLLGELDVSEVPGGTAGDVIPQPREEEAPPDALHDRPGTDVPVVGSEPGARPAAGPTKRSRPNAARKPEPPSQGEGAGQPQSVEAPTDGPPVAARGGEPPSTQEGRAAAVLQAARIGEELAAQVPEGPPPRGHREASDLEQKLASSLSFLRRRITGDYEVDDFGFDPEFTDVVVLNLLRPLYKKWFRVEVRGIENVPTEGGALVVANHSGTIALDALMTQVAVHDEHPLHRHLRMLGADLVFSLPFVGDVARKSGSTLAANPDAERLLSTGELVGVWPEGFKGIGKPFSERYKLQRFGRGGFVSAALRTGTPIVPCSIVGAEEIYPIIGNMPTLARLLGVPYVPVTPTWPLLGPLGLLPLPSKWLIEFGEPISTDDHGEGGAEDPMLVFDLTDQVRETIQQTLYSLLVSRRSVFF
ncbi:MAG: 1-acyl-sn-glycerol-3-phosphate acyltransferase [Actinomycetes bacterium]